MYTVEVNGKSFGVQMGEAAISRASSPSVVRQEAATSRNALINHVTIFLGLTAGSKLSAEAFLQLKTLGISAAGYGRLQRRYRCRCAYGQADEPVQHAQGHPADRLG